MALLFKSEDSILKFVFKSRPSQHHKKIIDANYPFKCKRYSWTTPQVTGGSERRYRLRLLSLKKNNKQMPLEISDDIFTQKTKTNHDIFT